MAAPAAGAVRACIAMVAARNLMPQLLRNPEPRPTHPTHTPTRCPHAGAHPLQQLRHLGVAHVVGPVPWRVACVVAGIHLGWDATQDGAGGYGGGSTGQPAMLFPWRCLRNGGAHQPRSSRRRTCCTSYTCSHAAGRACLPCPCPPPLPPGLAAAPRPPPSRPTPRCAAACCPPPRPRQCPGPHPPAARWLRAIARRAVRRRARARVAGATRLARVEGALPEQPVTTAACPRRARAGQRCSGPGAEAGLQRPRD